MLICTIYDVKSETVSPLFLAHNKDVAKRIFVSSLREDTPCVLYASDYELRIIGELVEDSASVCSLPRSSDGDGDFKYKIIPVSELIPDKYKKYCLDGTFEFQK